MKRTNTNEFISKVYNYLLDAIEAQDENTDKSPLELVEWLADEFDRVANYPFNLQRLPNIQDRMADYLRGLPIGIDYVYFDILKVSAKWHEVDKFDDKTENKIIENWFNFLALHCVRLIEKPDLAERFRA